jgi:crotonobetainyl-CoA:carnitine CoA-transferase CaiB-like acyl-CoA transferase
MTATGAASNLPLEGVRVLDLSRVWSGPACTRILADLGAEVIKVESVSSYDLTRGLYQFRNAPCGATWNKAPYFHIRNAGKLGVTLDLDQPEGLRHVRELIAVSDVVVENYTPSVMRRFGLEYEDVARINPHAIMLSMSGYGHTGPWSRYRAYGMGFEAASGLSSLTGYRDGPPVVNGNNFLDGCTGTLAAFGVLVALYHRGRGGDGQYVDLSQHEASIPACGEALMDYQLDGTAPVRTGNRSPSAAPQGIYPCRGTDEWLFLSIDSDAAWRAFCDVAQEPAWAADPRFTSVETRRQHHDAADDLIPAWTQTQDKVEAMHTLQEAGVIAAAVYNGKDVLLDPQLAERGFFTFEHLPEGGVVPIYRYLAARFSAMSPGPRFRAPRLGEHNGKILQSILGLGEGELARLEAAGVTGTEPVLAVSPEDFYNNMTHPLREFLAAGSLVALETDFEAVVARRAAG